MDQLKAVANSADVAREIEEHAKAAEEKEVRVCCPVCNSLVKHNPKEKHLTLQNVMKLCRTNNNLVSFTFLRVISVLIL